MKYRIKKYIDAEPCSAKKAKFKFGIAEDLTSGSEGFIVREDNQSYWVDNIDGAAPFDDPVQIFKQLEDDIDDTLDFLTLFHKKYYVGEKTRMRTYLIRKRLKALKQDYQRISSLYQDHV